MYNINYTPEDYILIEHIKHRLAHLRARKENNIVWYFILQYQSTEFMELCMEIITL